jgi:hypothetical protein
MMYALLWAETKIKIHMLQEIPIEQQKIKKLFTAFNESKNNNKSFKDKVIPSDQRKNEDLESKVEKLFKVLSRIAGDDQSLSQEMQDKVKMSGSFMKLVDKLLDLIYSAADRVHGPIDEKGGRETFVEQICSKVMDWTQYGAARNRSLSLPELSVESL